MKKLTNRVHAWLLRIKAFQNWEKNVAISWGWGWVEFPQPVSIIIQTITSGRISSTNDSYGKNQIVSGENRRKCFRLWVSHDDRFEPCLRVRHQVCLQSVCHIWILNSKVRTATIIYRFHSSNEDRQMVKVLKRGSMTLPTQSVPSGCRKF